MYEKAQCKKIMRYFNYKQFDPKTSETFLTAMGKDFREIIVDGYNLLHKLPADGTRRSLEERRENMETRLLGFQRSSRQNVTVVYDGNRAHGPSEEVGALGRVFTASGMTADEWIIDYLKSLGRSARMFTIVTSDRLIRTHASALGASCMLSEEFVKAHLKGTAKRTEETAHPDHPDKFGNGTLDDREVERWMKKFGSAEE